MQGKQNGLDLRPQRAFSLKSSLVLSFFILTTYYLLPATVSAATLAKPQNNLGLAGFWSLDEGTSTIAHDFSGNRNNGTIVNGTPLWGAGKRAQALTLTGGQWINMGASSAPSLTGSFTLSLFVKATTTGQGIAAKQVNLNGFKQFRIYFDAGGGIRSEWSSDGSTVNAICGGAALSNNGQWNMISVVYDSSAQTITIYKNGVASTPCTSANGVPSSLFNSGRTLQIGNLDNNLVANTLVGSVDDIRLYTRALSTTEIQSLYSAGETKMNASPTTQVTNGLVGYWTFDGPDVSGTTAFDRSGRGNNGTLTGSLTKVTGKLGQALSYSGNLQYVTIPFSSTLAPTASISFGAWIKMTDRSIAQKIISKTESGGFALSIDTNFGACSSSSICAIVNIGGTYYIAAYPISNLSNNVWYHVMGTYDGTVVRLYVNGVQVSSTAVTGNILYSSNNSLCIGSEAVVACNNGEYFKGSIDDVRVYNRALSSAEVEQLYNEGGSKLNDSSLNLQSGTSLNQGLVGLWTFDGPDVTDKVYDRSGQGNNAYFIGGATSTAKVIGKLGQGLLFNGSNTLVRTDSITGMSATQGSVSVWFNYAASGAQRQLFTQRGAPGDANNRVYLYLSAAGTLIIGLGNNGSIDTGVSVSTRTWHHALLTWNAGTYGVYLDGASVASGAYSGLVTIGSCVTLGSFNDICSGAPTVGSSPFNGSLDDIRVYSRALSAAEAKQLYLMGK